MKNINLNFATILLGYQKHFVRMFFGLISLNMNYLEDWNRVTSNVCKVFLEWPSTVILKLFTQGITSKNSNTNLF